MAKPTLTQVRSLGHLVTTDHYLFEVPTLPAGVGNPRPLGVKCLSTTMPGVSNETIEVKIHGHHHRQHGQRMNQGTIQLEFIDSVGEYSVIPIFRRWHELMVGTETGLSLGKAVYAVRGILHYYAPTGRELQTDVYENVFVRDIQDLQLSSEGAQAARFSISLAYDDFSSTTHTNL
jgi:hypothetical protein